MLKPVGETNTEWLAAASAEGGANRGDTMRVPYHATSMTPVAKLNYTAYRHSAEVVVSACQGDFVHRGRLIVWTQISSLIPPIFFRGVRPK